MECRPHWLALGSSAVSPGAAARLCHMVAQWSCIPQEGPITQPSISIPITWLRTDPIVLRVPSVLVPWPLTCLPHSCSGCIKAHLLWSTRQQDAQLAGPSHLPRGVALAAACQPLVLSRSAPAARLPAAELAGPCVELNARLPRASCAGPRSLLTHTHCAHTPPARSTGPSRARAR